MRDWVGERLSRRWQYFDNIIIARIQHCDRSGCAAKWGIQYSCPLSRLTIPIPISCDGCRQYCMHSREIEGSVMCVCMWERESSVYRFSKFWKSNRTFPQTAPNWLVRCGSVWCIDLTDPMLTPIYDVFRGRKTNSKRVCSIHACDGRKIRQTI